MEGQIDEALGVVAITFSIVLGVAALLVAWVLAIKHWGQR